MADHDIARPHDDRERMRPDLELIHDLMGGTARMRRAGLRWLPREQAESWEAWQQRLMRSVLFNGMSRCIRAMAGHIICGDVMLKNADHRILDRTQNVDGKGMSLNHFALRLAALMLRDGEAYIWVDMPREGGVPYFSLFEAGQMIGARRDEEGQVQQVRFASMFDAPEGKYGVRSGQQVNLYEHDRARGDVHYEIWQEQARGPHSGGVWAVVRDGKMAIDQMPMVEAKTGFGGMGNDPVTRPPLIDLAWLNLAHWQSASDQRHILHIARVPILFAKGIADGGAPLDIGPNRVIITDDPQADMKFIEHSGAAIEAGRQDLMDLEEQMMMMGLDMIAARKAHPTATGQVIEQTHHHAILGMVREAVRDAIHEAFVLMAMWMGLDEAAAGMVEMPKTEAVMMNKQKEAETLAKARRDGALDKDVFLSEIERRGVLNMN